MDVIEGLYPAFLELGYSPEAFWGYSIAEIMDLMTAHQKREERRQKQETEEFKNLVVALQVQALQIGQTFGGCDKQHPLKRYRNIILYYFLKTRRQKRENIRSSWTKEMPV